VARLLVVAAAGMAAAVRGRQPAPVALPKDVGHPVEWGARLADAGSAGCTP
jgi:hypothetical protein